MLFQTIIQIKNYPPPPENKCLVIYIIYKATIKNKINSKENIYIKATKNNYKRCYNVKMSF